MMLAACVAAIGTVIAARLCCRTVCRADARADDVAIIDVRAHCAFTDWMVLATVRSQRLAHMLAAAVLHRLKAQAKEVAPGVVPTIEGGLVSCCRHHAVQRSAPPRVASWSGSAGA